MRSPIRESSFRAAVLFGLFVVMIAVDALVSRRPPTTGQGVLLLVLTAGAWLATYWHLSRYWKPGESRYEDEQPKSDLSASARAPMDPRSRAGEITGGSSGSAASAAREDTNLT